MENNSSQSLLDIKEIKENIIILKNGGFRMILMASSINFSLKSAEEQDAIIYGYQSFINALDFPIQIVIDSKRMKVDSYLEKLKKIEKDQTNDLLKMQTAEYADFIKQLVDMSNIMSKAFYVAIPFSIMESKQNGIFDKIGSIFKQGESSAVSQADFQKVKEQIAQRADFIAENLRGIGIQTAPLGYQELIELFYGIYNSELSEKQGLGDIGGIAIG